jgi:phosphate transport system substrate-binding protein
MRGRNNSWMLIIAPVMVCALLLTGCAGASTADNEEVTISISGAFALFPMVTIWADEYGQLHPNVTFDIQAGGAGKGMTDVLAGAVDIAMLSREPRPEELEQGAFLIPTATDAVVATINADNPALDDLLRTGLSVEIGRQLWIDNQALTWGDVAGTDESAPVNVYTRSDSAGAAEVWALYLGGTGQEDLKGTAVNSDPGLAEAVRQDPLGIGFNNVAFAYDPTTKRQVEGIRVLPLDLNGDGQITPDEDFYATREDISQAIAARIYPYPPARLLYLVTKGAPSPAEAAFLRWVLTEGQAFSPDVGYVPLDEATLQEGLALLEE